jgi:hypothetical protein
MGLRKIRMNVGNKSIGTAITWAYPSGDPDKETFKIPTYALEVKGTNDAGRSVMKRFEAFRFGVQQKTSRSKPRVVGLSKNQTHPIKTWIPSYSVHSAASRERGAWKIYGNFLIHDGPDDPKVEVYASIGCVEICNGPQGFDKFNDFLISLSGASAATRAKKLVQIGKAKNMSISFTQATRPPLKTWP